MALRILIIHDYELVRTGLRAMLHDMYPDIFISEASNLVQGMSKIRTVFGLDIVLVNISRTRQRDLVYLRRISNQSGCLLAAVLDAQEEVVCINTVMQWGIAQWVCQTNNAKDIHHQLQNVLDQAIAGRNPDNDEVEMKGQAAAKPSVSGDVAATALTENKIHAINNLTKRQKEVLALLAAGQTNKQICISLGLSGGTVKNHITAILSALKANRRAKVAVLARKYLDQFSLQNKSNLDRERGMNSADDQRGELRFSPLETPSALCPPQAAGNSD